MTALIIVPISCSVDGSEGGPPATNQQPPESWSATQEGWRSGLIIGELPAGFALVTNVGNEAAIQHQFKNPDGMELNATRTFEPERFPIAGEPLESWNGITYFEGADGDQRSVFFERLGVRVAVSSRNFPIDGLLAVAKSITYDPAMDQWLP